LVFFFGVPVGFLFFMRGVLARHWIAQHAAGGGQHAAGTVG
jgi:hypothetical protein